MFSEPLNTAFSADTKLRARIYKVIEDEPWHETLFSDIARYHLQSHWGDPTAKYNAHEIAGSPSKKRKLDDGRAVDSAVADQPGTVVLEVRDISFSLPQRKKLQLEIVQYNASPDHKAETGVYAIRGRNPSTNDVEFEYSLDAFAYVLRLPVPEKAQKQYNFCLLPAEDKTTSAEALIWTVNHGPLKSCHTYGPNFDRISPGPNDVLENALCYILERSGNKLVFPTESEFASSLRESHRKSDIAYHVKAFRGSKEGYLFFLENGIFFGFKKPLTFFAFSDIESISYTSVLQRTFNLSILVRTSQNSEEPQEVEFSMLDQADFAGIDAYVKEHQLQDASLAEARRAKKVKSAGTKSTTAANAAGEQNGNDDDDGRTELEKAEAELEDEEDEMEEDYDPDEEGDSDASGSESGDDDYEYTKSKDRDLVKDELGSEAEDVSASEDEEQSDEEAETKEEEEEDEEEEHSEKQDAQPPNGQDFQHVQQPPSRVVPVDTDIPAYDDEDQL